MIVDQEQEGCCCAGNQTVEQNIGTDAFKHRSAAYSDEYGERIIEQHQHKQTNGTHCIEPDSFSDDGPERFISDRIYERASDSDDDHVGRIRFRDGAPFFPVGT